MTREAKKTVWLLDVACIHWSVLSENPQSPCHSHGLNLGSPLKATGASGPKAQNRHLVPTCREVSRNECLCAFQGGLSLGTCQRHAVCLLTRKATQSPFLKCVQNHDIPGCILRDEMGPVVAPSHCCLLPPYRLCLHLSPVGLLEDSRES